MSLRVEFPKTTDFEVEQIRAQYAYGYGAWPEGTLITDPFGVHPQAKGRYVDRRRVFATAIRKKAILDTTAAIIHTTTDQQIIDTTRRETPLQELVPMETARGKTLAYDVLSSRNAAIFAAETITLSTGSGTTDTYQNATNTLSIELAPGGWTDFAIASMAAQYPSRDARALEIRNKTWNLNEAHEGELINGNMSASANGGLGGNLSLGFNGIRAEIFNTPSGFYTPSTQLSKGANSVGTGDIDSIINACVQQNLKPNLGYTDLITWQNVKGLLMTQVRYANPETEIAWGLRAIGWQTPYGLLPLIADKFAPNLSGFREIGILDTKFQAQRVLLDATFELLAKTTIQQPFVVKKFVAYVDKTDYTPTPNLSGYQGLGQTSSTSKMGIITRLP